MKQEILVIDDNFDIRNLISEILKEKNYNSLISFNKSFSISFASPNTIMELS